MLKRKKRRSREFRDNSQVIDLSEARQLRKQKREDAARKKDRVKRPKLAMTERQAGKKARRRLVYFAVFLIMAGVIAVSAFNIINLKMTEAQTLKEQKELLEQKSRLQRIYSQVDSPDYIEQQARQQLKMIKPGEILYILNGEDQKNSKKTTGGGVLPDGGSDFSD